MTLENIIKYPLIKYSIYYLCHSNRFGSWSLQVIGGRMNFEAVETSSELFLGFLWPILRMNHEKHMLKIPRVKMC